MYMCASTCGAGLRIVCGDKYNKGIRANFRATFGERGFIGCLYPNLSPPLGDGITWDVRADSSGSSTSTHRNTHRQHPASDIEGGNMLTITP